MIALLLGVTVVAAPAAETQPESYFPPAFATPSIDCGFARGNREPILNEIEAGWYPQQLRAAAEPSLYAASLRKHATTTLRFTWLRSFHPPIVIRVEDVDSPMPRLIAKQLSGRGGYAPGTVDMRLERPLSPDEAGRLRTALSESHVFGLPPKTCELGSDGAEWLLEAVDRHGYHFVGRWSPQSGPVRDLGLLLVSFTGWLVKPIY